MLTQSPSLRTSVTQSPSDDGSSANGTNPVVTPPSRTTTSRIRLPSIVNQIQRLFAVHGALGVLRIFIAKAIGLVMWLTPARRRARAKAQDQDREFDRNYGVDTSGIMIPDESEVVGASWMHGSRYQGVDANALGQVLIELGINFEEFTFVDFGSGKGRAVLMASQFPFRKIIGVEYSGKLNGVAKRNLTSFKQQHLMHCQDVQLICEDALNVPVPNGPLVLFLYNPFGQAVMTELVQRISASFEHDRRRIIVLYFHALHANVWNAAGFLNEVRASRPISIYDSLDRNVSEWTAASSISKTSNAEFESPMRVNRILTTTDVSADS